MLEGIEGGAGCKERRMRGRGGGVSGCLEHETERVEQEQENEWFDVISTNPSS